MTRLNDVGGLTGFGPVGDRDDTSPFEEEWQRRICGLTMAFQMTGRVGEAVIRDAVDRMPPADYLAASPWERWVTGLTTILVEQDILSSAELHERAGAIVPVSLPAAEPSAATDAFPRSLPALDPGTEIRVREWHPSGHSRCPRYAQGKRGLILRRNATHALPDVEVATGELVPEHTYCVQFTARELWGDGSSDNELVHLDLYESYLVEES
jgi:nitrile hydratase subunit beta